MTDTNTCRCPSDLKARINQLRLQSAKDINQNMTLFQDVMLQNPENLCRRHLRNFAKRALGLYNSRKSSVLVEQLQEFFAAADKGEFQRNHSDWFSVEFVPKTVDEIALGVYQHHAHPISEIKIDGPVIFARYTKDEQAWGIWQREGTICIPDIFAYLKVPEIEEAISLEFDIYRYHLRVPHGEPTMGFA